MMGIPRRTFIGLAGAAADLEMQPGKVIGSCSFQYLFEPPPGVDSDWRPFIIRGQPMG